MRLFAEVDCMYRGCWRRVPPRPSLWPVRCGHGSCGTLCATSTETCRSSRRCDLPVLYRLRIDTNVETARIRGGI